MSRSFIIILTVISFVLTGVAGAIAQDTPESMLTIARKQADQARGKEGEDRVRVLEEAAALFRRVPTTWPDAGAACATAWFQSGDIDRRLGRLDRAEEAFKNALNVDGAKSVHVDALDGLAKIARKRKDYPAVEAALRRIIDEYASEATAAADARVSLVRLMRSQKRNKAAMAEAENMVADATLRARARVEAADIICSILLDHHRYEEAKSRLAAFDKQMGEGAQNADEAASVAKALKEMGSRRRLEPMAIED